MKVAVGKILLDFFFGPHEKIVCISHAVKQGKLIRAKRESGYAKREVALPR